MNHHVLSIVETTGIQSYIFGSNRLRENIGASFLVEEIARTWVRAALDQATNSSHNLTEDAQINDDVTLEALPGLHAEVVYWGGGNARIIFRDRPTAETFTRILSERLIREAPGIQIAVAHSSPFLWDPAGDRFFRSQPNHPSVIEETQSLISQAKRNRHSSQPLLGLGVTAACESTGLVAVDNARHYSLDEYLISHAIKRKLMAVYPANTKLHLSYKLAEDLVIPTDFDHLGRSHGDQSYIAVVHADANNMGKRFIAYANTQSTNRQYIRAMRALSRDVAAGAQWALDQLVETLLAHIHPAADGPGREYRIDDGRRFALTRLHDQNFLPFRPLIAGGDDVTFVCDGRLGLALASEYLRLFNAYKATAADGKPLHACAGVSIVKTHYPFARAYQLAEALCLSAKQLVKGSPYVEGGLSSDGSALDWHIASMGLTGDLDRIREREYAVSFRSHGTSYGGTLAARPLWVSPPVNNSWRTWQTIASRTDHFLSDDDWRNSRNKVLQLREVLRHGPHAVDQFKRLYRVTLPDRAEENHGWTVDHAQASPHAICGYFDAIEMMDFYWPLSRRGGA